MVVPKEQGATVRLHTVQGALIVAKRARYGVLLHRRVGPWWEMALGAEWVISIHSIGLPTGKDGNIIHVLTYTQPIVRFRKSIAPVVFLTAQETILSV